MSLYPAKKNEAKVNAQIRARDEYWIPCSIAIENLQNKVSELSKNENTLVSFTGEKSCESETTELLKYLQANNRIYFYERTRNILKLLEDTINNYENQINSDISAIIDIFCKQYSSMIESFPMYKINNCIDCDITTKKSLFEEIKTVLLTHRQIIWYGQIAHIVFFMGDQPYSSSFTSDMSYSSEKDIFDIWCEINEYGNSKDSFGLSPEQEIGLEVINFEYEHLANICDILNHEIETKDYQSLYVRIFEILSLLQEEILKNIDEATIL